MQLADLLILESPPAKLAKPLAVIADALHREFDCEPWIEPGISRRSCILASLAVRDFMRALEFPARIEPVACTIVATRDGQPLHSVGLGVPEPRENAPNAWNGHAVVVLPRERWLIDTTLYQARRAQWPDLTGMVAVPLLEALTIDRWGLRLLSGFAGQDDTGYECEIAWFANPTNTAWRAAPDAKPRRRAGVVARMLAQVR